MFIRAATKEEIIYINALMEEEAMRYTWDSNAEREHFVSIRRLTGGWDERDGMPADYGKPSNRAEVAEYIAREYKSHRDWQDYQREQERKRRERAERKAAREAAKTPEQKEYERCKRRLRDHERAIEQLTAQIERLADELAHHQRSVEEYREKIKKGA